MRADRLYALIVSVCIPFVARSTMVLPRWNLGKSNDGKDRVTCICTRCMPSIIACTSVIASSFDIRGHGFILNADCDIKRYS